MGQRTPTFSPQLEILEDRLVPTFFAANFPGAGVFRFTEALTDAVLLTPQNATAVSVAPNGDVAAAIPGVGTLLYPLTGGVQELTSSVPAALDITSTPGVRDSGIFSFPGFGVYRFDGNGNFTQLSSLTALAVAIAPNGDALASFLGFGTVLMPARGGFQELTPYVPSSLGITSNTPGIPDSIVFDFPFFGVFLMAPDNTLISVGLGKTATIVTMGANGNVFAVLPGHGIFSLVGTSNFYIPDQPSAFDAQ